MIDLCRGCSAGCRVLAPVVCGPFPYVADEVVHPLPTMRRGTRNEGRVIHCAGRAARSAQTRADACRVLRRAAPWELRGAVWAGCPFPLGLGREAAAVPDAEGHRRVPVHAVDRVVVAACHTPVAVLTRVRGLGCADRDLHGRAVGAVRDRERTRRSIARFPEAAEASHRHRISVQIEARDAHVGLGDARVVRHAVSAHGERQRLDEHTAASDRGGRRATPLCWDAGTTTGAVACVAGDAAGCTRAGAYSVDDGGTDGGASATVVDVRREAAACPRTVGLTSRAGAEAAYGADAVDGACARARGARHSVTKR